MKPIVGWPQRQKHQVSLIQAITRHQKAFPCHQVLKQSQEGWSVHNSFQPPEATPNSSSCKLICWNWSFYIYMFQSQQCLGSKAKVWKTPCMVSNTYEKRNTIRVESPPRCTTGSKKCIPRTQEDATLKQYTGFRASPALNPELSMT